MLMVAINFIIYQPFATGGHFPSFRMRFQLNPANTSKTISTKIFDRLVKYVKNIHPENERLVQAYLADPENFVVPEGYRMMENTETGRGGKVHRAI